jgi:Tol biopolymer transport system component
MTRYAVPLATLMLTLVLVPNIAQATEPGKNGEIALSTLVNGTSQVFTVNPDGARLRQITHRDTGAGQFGLAWSPDGTGLLFTVTDSKGKDQIVKARADGGGVTVISPACTGTCLGDDGPAYSPDGKKIAFERAFGPIVKGNASVVAIFTMNSNGRDLTQLTQKSTPTTSEDHSPRWSPDGMRIAFVRFNTTAPPSKEGAIEVMNSDGSNIRRLTSFATDAADPRWSPDGTRILFNTYAEATREKSSNLYTMHIDGTHLVALTHYTGGALQAVADDWSPDGKKILYRRLVLSGTSTQAGAFYTIDKDGKHPRPLTNLRITSDSARAAWGTRTD